MIFKLILDKNSAEEVVATVHERTPLVDEIEKLVLSDNLTDSIPGYLDDEITMLRLDDIECFYVRDEKTYAVCAGKEVYQVKSKLFELEQKLPDNYERISKSAICNWKKIVKFKVQLSGAVDAVFESGYSECISRRCFAELRRRYGL